MKVFLSHDSADKPAVEALALRLRQEAVRGFEFLSILTAAPQS